MDLVGIELEAFSRRERRGSLLPKSRAQRGTSIGQLLGELVDLVGIEPTASSMPFNPDKKIQQLTRTRGPSFGFLYPQHS